MQLLSKVIKQVDGPMEDWLVPSKIDYEDREQEVAEISSIEERKQLADDILANSRIEAKKLLDDTNKRVRALEQEAYEKGYKKGEEEACQSHAKAREEFYASTKKVLQEVENIREQIYKDTEEELLELAINIAQKLACSQLALKPETIADIAKEACSQVKECEMVIVYVPPEQLEIISARQEEIAAQLFRTRKLKIIADPNITLGGCRIETEQGYVDATIETMLEQLNRVLRNKQI